MKPKHILCLALVLSGGLFGCSTGTPPDDANVNDGFQLETQINLVEKAASDSALPVTNWTNEAPCFVMDDALDELKRHHWLWATNTTIPPRLSRAVLTIFPSITNASMPGPQPGDGLMWCNAICMLGKTCDPAMVALLRPYLDEKSLAGDPGGSSAGNPTTMRFCDEAANAIESLLDDRSAYYGTDITIQPIFTNGVVSTNWQYWDSKPGEYRAWPGYDPAWKEWDKRIAKLKKRLDTLGLTNVTVVYSNLSYPFAVTNEALPAGFSMPGDKLIPIDPNTGLPIQVKPDKQL